MDINFDYDDTLAGPGDELLIDFFEELDAVRAYCLGYIFADGSVIWSGKRGYAVGLQLWCKRSDEALILKIRELLGSHHKVTRDFCRDKEGNIIINKDGKPRERTSVSISSTYLAESLIGRGVLVGKSFLDLPFPDYLEDDLLPHFVRGYFDGDGSFGIHDYEYATSVKNILNMVGTEQFIWGLRDRVVSAVGTYNVTPVKNKNSWYVQWQGLKDLQRIRDWMYPPGNTLYLVRKKEILDKLGEFVDDRIDFPNPTSALEMLIHLIYVHGVSQAEVAQSCGMGESLLSQTLLGNRPMSSRKIAEFARFFEVDPEVFSFPISLPEAPPQGSDGVTMLRYLIDLNSMNQKELAEEIQVTPTTLSRILTRQSVMKIRTARKLADFFYVDPEVFLVH